MRILVAIPHYYRRLSPHETGANRHGSHSDTPASRTQGLAACIAAFHQLFGPEQHVINIAERRTVPAPRQNHIVHVVVCTVPNSHLLDGLELDRSMLQHSIVDTDPQMLGFACHAVLRDRWGNYDYYCYAEDDLILSDPWFFHKLAWFAGHVGNERLLLPNRFERGRGPHLHKVYVDGDLAPHVTSPFQDTSQDRQLLSTVMGRAVAFRRPLNPHAGCFFLNASQMQSWINKDFFLNRDTSFVGPLESAATLGIMRTFKIYKPIEDSIDFLEVEHFGSRFIGAIRWEEKNTE